MRRRRGLMSGSLPGDTGRPRGWFDRVSRGVRRPAHHAGNRESARSPRWGEPPCGFDSRSICYKSSGPAARVSCRGWHRLRSSRRCAVARPWTLELLGQLTTSGCGRCGFTPRRCDPCLPRSPCSWCWCRCRVHMGRATPTSPGPSRLRRPALYMEAGDSQDEEQGAGGATGRASREPAVYGLPPYEQNRLTSATSAAAT